MAPPARPSASLEIPGYRVDRALGAGAIGTVYLASPEQLPGAQRALKVLHAPSESSRLRLAREGELLARVDHPNLVRVHDYGVSGGRAYLAMEYVDGEDVGTVLRREGSVGWERARAWGLQAARGLACLHAAGIVHRDVKPENLILDAEGRLRVSDLGLGRSEDSSREKLTVTGAILGTPLYAAPEQALAKGVVSGKSDVYALGAPLYELCAGRPPLIGDCMPRQLFLLMEVTPEPLRAVADVPRALDALVMRMLQKSPEDRPSMEEVVERLERLRSSRRTGPIRLGLALLAGLGLVAALGVDWGLSGAPPRPAAATRQVAAPVQEAPPSRAVGERRMLRKGEVELELVRVGPRLWLARSEVTWAQWRAFAEATNRGAGPREPMLYAATAEHPVVNVTACEAEAFCRWLGGRLPTHEEWRAAATQGGKARWPWGDAAPDDGAPRLNFSGGPEATTSVEATLSLDGHAFAAPVGSFPGGASPAGALDLCGNVAEWSADRLHGARRVNGGHFLSGLRACDPETREALAISPERRSHHVGFRLALDD